MCLDDASPEGLYALSKVLFHHLFLLRKLLLKVRDPALVRHVVLYDGPLHGVEGGAASDSAIVLLEAGSAGIASPLIIDVAAQEAW